MPCTMITRPVYRSGQDGQGQYLPLNLKYRNKN